MTPKDGYELYVVWEKSNGLCLPYGGGWFDQPWWYRQLIVQHINLDAWHEWNSKRPTTEGLPGFENI